MSQHDYVIDNASGATVRADINSALGAIQSLNSGTSAPSSTAAGMLWLDTTGGAPYVLKVRDAGNNHWLTVGNVTDPGADGNLELLPGKINLPSSGGVFESDGSTEILTESSGAVTLKNTTIDGTVSMASSGLTVRNITQVSLASDQTLVNDATDTTFFSPTYTPLFSGSKVAGILMVYGFVNRSASSEARKNLKLAFTGSGITDLTTFDSVNNIGVFDHGGSGAALSLQQLIGGQLLTTSSTATITCNCKLANPTAASTSEWTIYGNNTLTETHFTWIEYK